MYFVRVYDWAINSNGASGVLEKNSDSENAAVRV